ncbi:hypothetical protein JKP88DRAFT_253949 [Tribonema minus]|uniref:Uncharacterized protein n=1 Tax=Tribonema minus TaxID=303371 RepID=A0A836CJK0_9STRA|nr:hypothetical protein JKP88DRAFT_253949 [Tribonema minus]
MPMNFKVMMPTLCLLMASSSGNAFMTSFKLPSVFRCGAARMPASASRVALCMANPDVQPPEETLLQQTLREAREVKQKLNEVSERIARVGAIRAVSDARMADTEAALSSFGQQVEELMKAGVHNLVLRQSPDLQPLATDNLVQLAGLFGGGDEARLKLADSAACELLAKRMVPQVMSRTLSKLKAYHRVGEHIKWMADDDEVDVDAVESFIRSVLADRANLSANHLEERTELNKALAQLMADVKAVQRGSNNDGVKVLMQKAAGVTCAIAYTCERELEEPFATFMPPQVQQKEALASVKHIPTLNKVVIQVCHVQALLEYDTSVRELGIQLKLLAWLARIRFGSSVDDELIGELSVASYGDDPLVVVDSKQRSLARALWGFELVVVPYRVSRFKWD